MHFEHVAFVKMQPGDDDDLVARVDPVQRSREGGVYFQPGVRRSFGTLSRRLVQRSQRRANVTDGMERIFLRRTRSPPFMRAASSRDWAFPG